MNETVQTIAVILAITGVLLAGYLFFGNPFEQQLNPIDVALTVSPESATIGSPIQMTVEGTGSIEKIELTSQEFSETLDCAKATCTKTFSEQFQNPGVYQVTVKATGQGKTIEKSKTVFVTDSTKRCADGTAFGSCSKTAPNFCNSGILIEKCSECGCPNGEACNGDSCSEKILPITIGGISFEGGQVYKKQTVILNIDGTNSNSDTINGRKYSFAVDFENPSDSSQNFSVSQEFSVDGLAGNSNKTFSFPVKILGAGTLNVKVSESYSGSQLEERVFEKAMTAMVDSTPPGSPENLSAVVQNNAVNLSWSVSDSAIAELRLYKSNSLQAGYTTYSLYSILSPETRQTQASGLESGRSVFVISAVDQAGNESGYSNLAIADIP